MWGGGTGLPQIPGRGRRIFFSQVCVCVCVLFEAFLVSFLLSRFLLVLGRSWVALGAVLGRSWGGLGVSWRAVLGGLWRL